MKYVPAFVLVLVLVLSMALGGCHWFKPQHHNNGGSPNAWDDMKWDDGQWQ